MRQMACKLRLWSVNAVLVATVTSDTTINCVCMSSLTDGVSENVVAAGLDDGSIMLWESLDLAPIIKLFDPRWTKPVTSIMFADPISIIAGMADGSILCFSQPRSGTGRKLAPPLFSAKVSSLRMARPRFTEWHTFFSRLFLPYSGQRLVGAFRRNCAKALSAPGYRLCG